MEQVAVQGANQVFITSPAGYASKDVSGAANVVLGTSEGDADIIELTGALTGNIIVTIPTPNVPMVVGTAPNTGAVAPGWAKKIKNSTSGAFTITVIGPGGVGVPIPQGSMLSCISKDGVNVQAVAGAVAPGSAAIGLDFVFQPGGTAGGNIYTTEASLWQAILATALVTGGPLVVAIDGSKSFPVSPTFLLPHDCLDGRVFFTGSTDFNDFPAVNTLVLADGATLTNPGGASGNIVIAGTCATAPAMSFTVATGALAGSGRFFFMGQGAVLQNNGAHAYVDLLVGQSLTFFMGPQSGVVIGGAGAMFNLTVAASTLILLVSGLTQGTFGANNLVAGVGASNLYLLIDDTYPVGSTNPNFLGTLHLTRTSQAAGMGFSQANQPVPVLPLTLMTAQQAIDMHYSPTVTVGAGPVTVDATRLDQSFKATAAALQFNIPAGFPVGRELSFCDASGTAGGNAFTLAPAAGEEIGAAGLGVAVTYTQVAVKTLTIKKTDPTVWTVWSSTTLV